MTLVQKSTRGYCGVSYQERVNTLKKLYPGEFNAADLAELASNDKELIELCGYTIYTVREYEELCHEMEKGG